MLLGYTGETRGTLYENHYFPGGCIAHAAAARTDGPVTYSDGTNATKRAMATDVATFLQWAADPHMEERKRMGVAGAHLPARARGAAVPRLQASLARREPLTP